MGVAVRTAKWRRALLLTEAGKGMGIGKTAYGQLIAYWEQAPATAPTTAPAWSGAAARN